MHQRASKPYVGLLLLWLQSTSLNVNMGMVNTLPYLNTSSGHNIQEKRLKQTRLKHLKIQIKSFEQDFRVLSVKIKRC